MNRNSYKRSGIDRRKKNGINVRIFVGNGNRTTIRRQEDKDRIFFVDQYGPVLFVAVAGIFFLGAIDALLTLRLLDHAAYETNPLMAYMLDHGPYAFFLFKYGLTLIAACALFLFRGVVIRKFKITTHSFLDLAAWLYVAVVGWELYLIFYVI